MLGIRTRGKTLLAVVMLATLSALTVLAPAATVFAQESGHHGGEASLALPDLKSVTFVGGIDGHTLLLFGLIGMAGSYSVAWFGIRINTLANSRTAFASLTGKPYSCYAIPLRAGMSIGMALISVELLIMLIILLFIPGDMAGPCFIGFAIG